MRVRHSLFYRWPIIALVLTCCAICRLHGTLQVVSVSSFVPCVTGAASSANGAKTFNCANTGLTTVVDAFLSSTFSVDEVSVDNVEQAQVTDQAGTFFAQFTVVPVNASRQSQTTSLSECQSTEGNPCQTTVPVEVTYEMLPPVYTWKLTRVSSRKSGALRAPFTNLYGGTAVYDSPERTSPYGNTFFVPEPACRLISTTGMHQSNLEYPTQVNVTRIFENSTLNANYLKCFKTADDLQAPLSEPPAGIGLNGASMLEYHFTCSANVRNNSAGTTTSVTFPVFYYGQFFPLSPGCDIWAVSGQPQVIAGIRINGTVLADYAPLNLTRGDRETLTLITVQDNLLGTSAVSEPKGLIQAKVLNIVTPSGNSGPYMPPYFVTCSNNPDGVPLSLYPRPDSINPLTVEATGNAAPRVAPQIANPWLYDPDALFGKGKLPIPSSMQFMTQGDDPFAMFYFLNNSQLGSVNSECGAMCVDPNIYSHPPPVLSFTGVIGGQRDFVFNLSSILPIQQGGLGLIGGTTTCVPLHGLGFNGVTVTMPCNARSDMAQTQAQIAALLADGSPAAIKAIKLMRIPHQSPYYDPLRANFWTANQTLFYQPTRGRGQSSAAARVELVTSFSGDFLGYASLVPKAEIQTLTENPDAGFSQGTTTFCSMTWTSSQPNAVQGAVAYRVCNPTNGTQLGSYEVRTTCGLSSLFRPDTNNPLGGEYIPGPDEEGRSLTTLNVPSEIVLNNVRSGQCRTPQDSGFLYFQGTLSVLQPPPATGQAVPTFAELQDAGGVTCIVSVYSTQSILPGSVLVSKQTVSCTASDQSASSTNPILIPTPATPHFPPPLIDSSVTSTPTTTPTPPNNAPDIGRVEEGVIYGVVIGAFVLAVIVIIAACVASNTKLRRH